MKKLFYFVAICLMAVTVKAADVVTFEEVVTLSGENADLGTRNYQNNFYDEDLEEGMFTSPSGDFVFNNFWMDYGSMDYWGGFAISARTETTYETLTDQYNSCVGHGVNGSSRYAVFYWDSYNYPMPIQVGTSDDQQVSGFYVTNTAWVVKSILEGDGMSDAFATGDYLKLIITGTNSSDESKTVEVYLADYTSENEADHYYLKDWTWVDLTSLGVVNKISFKMEGTKQNTYGLTTPTYFCMDDFNGEAPVIHNGPATMEDLELADESFWNGSDGTGSFISGGYRFENGYETSDYGPYAYGFYYTNRTSTAYTGLNDMYNSCVGHGAENSKTYATYNVNDWTPKGVEVLAEEGEVISGFYVTNAAYTLTSMLNGDKFAKKFDTGDWLKVTITGYAADGTETGTVDFYLADLRNANYMYIHNTWRWVDLTSLGKVKRLGFTMSSSDSSEWGMNTPAYFCLDNLGGEKPETEEPIVTGIRNHQNTTCTMQRFDLNGRQLKQQTKGMNIIRMADGTVRKVMVK